jgi:hypothetical protein
MAEDIASGGEAAKTPQDAAPNSEPKNEGKSEAKGELPEVDSPALSPAGDAPETVPDTALVILPPAAKAGAQSASARFRIRPRHKHRAVLATSVAVAAGIGVLVGSLLAGTPSAPPPDTAGLHRQQAMQQSITRLNKEVASLKTDLAAGKKSARSRIAKITERLRSAPEITGSIPVPPAAIPTPLPRPAVRAAAAAIRVVPDWTIYDVRNGYVYVKGHGDIYEVARGAPLPGLGPVQEIRRRDGRWMVVTPKGLIVSLRDRRHFAPN